MFKMCVYMAPNTTRGNVKEVASSFCDECFSILVQKRMVGGRGPPRSLEGKSNGQNSTGKEKQS